MKWFKEALDLPSWADASRFDPPTDPISLERYEDALATCVDYCGPDSYEVALLNRGIATNHGQMPQRLRRLMTDLIDRRICPITVATATLTEGVNLPFDLIFVLALRRQTFDSDTQRSVIAPLSTSEFRNLAGRAGRPGATRGTEGMTLVAIPTQPSTTAPAQLRTQRNQIREMRADYESLIVRLRQEEQAQNIVISPLSLLLQTIADRAAVFGISGVNLLRWLEETAPADIDNNAGIASNTPTARLADSLDELDGFLLTALEELSASETQELNSADAESMLIRLWNRTFSNVAAVQEAWMEKAFVRRGQGLIDTIYPDPEERRRLFQYGFTPHVGRRFETIAPTIHETIEHATSYGENNVEERFSLFEEIGLLIATDRGFGFRTRNTISDNALLQRWPELLKWWMQVPGASLPNPEELRAWQRFISDNIDFRLGVAIGAVVAQAWSAGSNDPMAVPSLELWRQTTKLPWVGFWARELLRWGTLDPFVAFALAQGLAKTRNEAADRRPEFNRWMIGQYENITADDWIDPQYFLEWQITFSAAVDPPSDVRIVEVGLTGANGSRGLYEVLPLQHGDRVQWIDPAGYEIATSIATAEIGIHSYKNDFELIVHRGRWTVRRAFHNI